MIEAIGIAVGRLIDAVLPIETIHEYEQGVKFRFGKIVKLYKKPRIVFYWPIIESIETRSFVEEVASTSSVCVDMACGKTLRLAVALRFTITNLQQWYTAIQDFEESMMELVQGHIPDAVMDYTADELRSKRKQVLDELKIECDDVFAEWGVNLDDIRFNCFARTRCMDHAVDMSHNGDEE